jgi:hypothetical protein
MIRPLLSLKRLFFDETAGKVRYQYSRHGSQEESMDYLEFIARVTSHIPDKGQVMIRYYGLYSICFVSAKFGPFMMFLKRGFTQNKITGGGMHEYQEIDIV